MSRLIRIVAGSAWGTADHATCSLLSSWPIFSLVVAGCEKESETTPSGAPAPVPQASEQAADDMKAKTEDASERAKDAADKASDSAAKTAEGASDALKKNADAAADAVAKNPAAAESQKQVAQVMDYIKEKKWDMAESTLKTLEANKASLPVEVQSQLLAHGGISRMVLFGRRASCRRGPGCGWGSPGSAGSWRVA